MAVIIHSDIGRAVFSGLRAAYFGDQPVSLRNSTGILLVGADQPVAPTITRQPSILPQEAGIGDSITLDIGEAAGLPAPVASWDFTLNGVSIKGRLDRGATTIELAETGIYELTVAWTNSADSVMANTVALTVAPPLVPPIDYARVTLAYIDVSATITGSDADVGAITARGTGAYVFTKAGSGTAIRRTSDGFAFADGAYVQTQVLSAQPTTDGLFAVADLTLTSYGSNVGQIIDGTGVNLKLRNSAGAIQVLGPVSGQGALSLGTVAYGTRVIVAGQLDDVADLLSGISIAGTAVSAPHTGLVDPLPTRFTIGRYLNGTLHRLAIVGRPEGGAWPVTMAEVVADFRRGA